MKVGLVIYGSLHTLSGGYLYDRMLVRELRRAGCHVDIVSLPWRNYPRHLLDNLRLDLVDKIAHAQYDILLQDELNHPSLILLNHALKQFSTTPIVSIVHHLRSHEKHHPLQLRLYRAVERAYLRTIDAFLVNSWSTRRATESLLSESRPFHVAYPAADHVEIPPRDVILSRINEAYATDGRRSMNLAFVGNITARKALHDVVESLGYLQNSHPQRNVTLHVVGDLQVDPVYVANIKRRIQALQIHDHIVFHGRVSTVRLQDIFLGCEILVLPSFEGFGITYLEAMAYGLCPIAATGSAAQEMIQPGTNGLLVQSGRPQMLAFQLNELWEQPETLRTLRAGALDTQAGFGTWERSFGHAYQWLCEIVSTRIST